MITKNVILIWCAVFLSMVTISMATRDAIACADPDQPNECSYRNPSTQHRIEITDDPDNYSESNWRLNAGNVWAGISDTNWSFWADAYFDSGEVAGCQWNSPNYGHYTWSCNNEGALAHNFGVTGYFVDDDQENGFAGTYAEMIVCDCGQTNNCGQIDRTTPCSQNCLSAWTGSFTSGMLALATKDASMNVTFGTTWQQYTYYWIHVHTHIAVQSAVGGVTDDDDDDYGCVKYFWD